MALFRFVAVLRVDNRVDQPGGEGDTRVVDPVISPREGPSLAGGQETSSTEERFSLLRATSLFTSARCGDCPRYHARVPGESAQHRLALAGESAEDGTRPLVIRRAQAALRSSRH